MSKLTTYKDLIVWQKAINLVKSTYNLTLSFPEDEKFGLTSQIKRASVSIPSNIAEGWGRTSTKEFIKYLKISRGSLFELETQVIIAKELNYIIDCNEIEGLIEEISKMLNALIKKLESKK